MSILNMKNCRNDTDLPPDLGPVACNMSAFSKTWEGVCCIRQSLIVNLSQLIKCGEEQLMFQPEDGNPPKCEWRPNCTSIGPCSTILLTNTLLSDIAIFDVILAIILLLVFFCLLRLLYLNNRRALSGVSNAVDDYYLLSIHVIFLQMCILWAILWAVHLVFHIRTETKYSMTVHAAIRSFMNAFNVLLEGSLWMFLLTNKMGRSGLFWTELFATVTTMIYFGCSIFYRTTYPVYDPLKVYEHHNVSYFDAVYYALFGALFMITLGIHIIMKKERNPVVLYTGVMTPYYIVRTTTSLLLSLSTVTGVKDSALCINSLVDVMYFGAYAILVYRVLLIDARQWTEQVASLRIAEQIVSLGLRGLSGKEMEKQDPKMADLSLARRYRELLVPSAQLFPIKGIIGQGAMGVVKLFMFRGEKVAVKQMNWMPMNSAYIGMFRKEVDIHSKLTPINQSGRSESESINKIVRFMGVYFDRLRVGIVMEYCSRGNLFELLLKANDNGCFPLTRTPLAIAEDIAIALEYLHSKQIVHRDIKSLNILLHQDECAKLADFGAAHDMSRKLRMKLKKEKHKKVKSKKKNKKLSHRTSSRSRKSKTRRRNEKKNCNCCDPCLFWCNESNYYEYQFWDEGLGGTIPWISPEALNKGRITPASDIYSFGIVLWELITWSEPFILVPSEYEFSHPLVISDASLNSELSNSAIFSSLDNEEYKIKDSKGLATQPLLSCSNIEEINVKKQWSQFPLSENFQSMIDDNLGHLARRYIVENNYRPPIPKNCPIRLEELLTKCWGRKPSSRPSATELLALIREAKEHEAIYRYPLKII